jgi:hypothetical protein
MVYGKSGEARYILHEKVIAIEELGSRALEILQTQKKDLSVKLLREAVFCVKTETTMGGLSRPDLVLNKTGRIVSRKRSTMGKRNNWIAAVMGARAILKLKGFVAVKKGTIFYKIAKKLNSFA